MTYWEKYIFEDKKYERTSKKDGKKLTSSEINKKGREALESEQKKNKKAKGKGKEETSNYTKYLQQQLEFKKQKYEDQKKRQLEKGKEAAETEGAKAKKALASVKVQKIGYKDPELTAHSKAIENLGSLAAGLAKGAYHGAKALQKKKEAKDSLKKQNEKKDLGKPGRPKREESRETGPKNVDSSERKALPPGKLISKRRRLPASSEGGFRVGQPAKRIGQPSPDRPQLPYGVDKRKMLKPSSEGERRTAGPAEGSRTEPTLGQRARQNKKLKTKLIQARMEEYSNWKEEFLFEIEEKGGNKEKISKKKIIDVMKGKNKIEMNPRIMEDHNEIASGKKKDDEGYMANVELDQMERAIKALRKKIKKADTQMPAWVQSKITRAADYIDTASEYMQSDEKLSEELDKKKILMLMVLKALENAKRRKNSQLINGIIGEGVEIEESKKSEMKCNKPRAEAHGSGETGKSHVVKACEGGKERLIRFGQLGVKGSPKKKGESKKYASRRHRFQTRHAKNIKKGKMSAAYWANKVKW